MCQKWLRNRNWHTSKQDQTLLAVATAMTTTAAAGLRLSVSYRVSDGIAELPQEEYEKVHVCGEPEPVSLSYRRAVFFELVVSD